MKRSAWVFRHGGEWTVSTGELTLQALRDFGTHVPGGPYTACVGLGHHGKFRVFFKRDEVEWAGARAREWLEDRDRASRFFAESALLARRMREFWSLAERSADTPDEHLARRYERGNRLLAELLAYYQLSGADLGGAWLARVRGYCLPAFNPREVLQCLLAADTRPLETYQERRAWLKLCETRVLRGSVAPLAAPIARHAARYLHILHGPGESGRMVDVLRNRLEVVDAASCDVLRAQLRCATGISETAAERARACAERLGLPDDLFRACRSVAHLSVTRLSQRESLQHGFLHRNRLLRTIRDRIERRGVDLAADVMQYVTNEELMTILRAGVQPDAATLRRRANTCLVELASGEVRLYAGMAAERRRRELGIAKVERTADDLGGTPVAGARAGIGEALVVTKTSRDAIPTVGVRDRVVVTEMIRPYMVPLLTGAAAIITEEGGVTSHAAVLARELRIPCVVGVSGATRRLRTGTPLFVSVRTGSVYRLSPERFTALRTRLRPPPERHDKAARAPIVTRTVPDIVPLASARRYGAAAVGGKAMNLADIAHLTPRGFVVTTAGAEHVSFPSNGSAERFRQTLIAALTDLGAQRLAVRSSHPYEDSRAGSYAGLFTTVLDVRPDDCWAALRHVVRSPTSDLAAGYGAPGRLAAPAVLIQELVEAVVSGTVLSGLRRRGRSWLVLEYVFGGSEGLSSGCLTPLCSALSRDQDRVEADRLIPPIPTGVLSPDVLGDLLETAVRMEAVRGHPQEIEWGVDAAGKLWLFQARPLSASLDGGTVAV